MINPIPQEQAVSEKIAEDGMSGEIVPGIPNDVWHDAKQAMAGSGWYANSMILGAARAILVERERCARIAEGYADAINEYAAGIAQSIRGEEP